MRFLHSMFGVRGQSHGGCSKPVQHKMKNFAQTKLNGRNWRLPVATFDRGGLRNVDVTRVSLACAIQKERWPVNTWNSEPTKRGRSNGNRPSIHCSQMPMLATKAQYRLGDAKEYFAEHLSVGDYYTEGQQVLGAVVRRGSREAGLSGVTRQDDFVRLCENLHPQTGRS